MTLLVSVYARDPLTGARYAVEQDTGAGGQGDRTLAGFEHCRGRLWGAPSVRALGCMLLPTLAVDNLHISGAELAVLDADCALIEEHVPQVAAATHFTSEFILFRTGNIREAVRMAQALPEGMVVIW